MPHRDFDAGRTRVDLKKDGPSFELADRTWHCLPALPAGSLQRIALAVRVDGEGRQIYDSPNVIRFLVDAIAPRRWVSEPTDDDPAAGHWVPSTEREDFRHLCDYDGADAELIEIETLGGIMDWLLEEYQGRPT